MSDSELHANPTGPNLANMTDALPDLPSYRLAVCDLNGILRGKRFSGSVLSKVLAGEARLPASILACDVWGADLAFNKHLEDTGDGDAVCMPFGSEVHRIDWTPNPSGLVRVWMANEDGSPFAGDPRRELSFVLDRYAAKGLVPVVAIELEFYLTDPESSSPIPISDLSTGRRLSGDSILSLNELDQLEGFFADVFDACGNFGISAETATSENGPAQFEINLKHRPDALRAADDAVNFKYLIRGIARKHGFLATFMAKPYGTRSGSSMHVHFSLNDNNGRNLFDDGTETGSATMRRAVGGLLEHMQGTQLVFAPNFNSYRRPRSGTLAPLHPTWGYENRTTAIRIPGGPHSGRRIEHRLAGADCNPYLVLAAVLGSALDGITRGIEPPGPVSGFAYGKGIPRLRFDWQSAISAFSTGQSAKMVFTESMLDMYVTCKQYELERFQEQVSQFEYETYLESV